MPKKGVKTNRISRRDGAVCGVHLSGCMRPIENKGDRSLDHIIPQSFYLNPAFGLDSKAFGDDWNLQVMHKTCNVKRGGFVHGLPCFSMSLSLLPSVREGPVRLLHNWRAIR